MFTFEGVIIWEITSFGQIPYMELDNSTVITKVSEGHRLSKPKMCPQSLWTIVGRCFAERVFICLRFDSEQSQRPSLGDLLEPFAAVLQEHNVQTSVAELQHAPPQG